MRYYLDSYLIFHYLISGALDQERDINEKENLDIVVQWEVDKAFLRIFPSTPILAMADLLVEFPSHTLAFTMTPQ